MPGELEAFKEAVGQAEQLWRAQRKGKATYEEVVFALEIADKKQYEASQQRGSYSTDKQGELARLYNVLRDMRGVIIKPDLKRTAQPYPGPVNIV
jgi:hypothetical protein